MTVTWSVMNIIFLFGFFLGGQADWGLNLELCAWKEDVLLLEPHLQSIFLWLIWRWADFEPQCS
jgi:hypothetical protein